MRHPESAVAQQLADLERTDAALVLATGMAAVASTLMTLLVPGDHLVASTWLRADTRHFFVRELPALGVQVSFVDPTETRGWRRALMPNTRLLFVESPVDPTTRVVDLRAPRALAQELGLAFVVDSTLAGPVHFRPVECGADVVVHAASAVLDGHHDGVAGVVCGTDTVIEEIRHKMRAWGAEPHPAAVASLARGLQTLAVRVAQQSASAQTVATWAEQQPAFTRVWYPGLASHPDHAVAAACLAGYGSVMAVECAGGDAAAAQLLAQLQRFDVCAVEDAPRLGGARSAASALSAVPGLSDGAIRFNIGLDDSASLIDDLSQAME
ncbi:MAG: PLP-dependent transferase [Gemmatimonadota bacterium]|nr:PLP-dependent transferase [Gemmatimonadota bacterium]MDQ8168222.1 PLP-dependent transferase [Gemmatimonadota bacterium]MDQ8171407.1 PLP-dependent transferase [Gemmatimonadota bacterium]